MHDFRQHQEEGPHPTGSLTAVEWKNVISINLTTTTAQKRFQNFFLQAEALNIEVQCSFSYIRSSHALEKDIFNRQLVLVLHR